jgi:hypothetical protein
MVDLLLQAFDKDRTVEPTQMVVQRCCQRAGAKPAGDDVSRLADGIALELSSWEPYAEKGGDGTS